MNKIFLISFIFSAVAFSQTLIPKLPQITASSFLLIDAKTNKIIAQQNPEASTGLASITKIMTSYIVADYLKQGFLNIKDSTTVSEKCWRMERLENVHPRRQKGSDRRFDARHDYSIWE